MLIYIVLDLEILFMNNPIVKQAVPIITTPTNMNIVATLFFISKLGLSNPPQEHLTIEVAEVRVARVSREDIQLAA